MDACTTNMCDKAWGRRGFAKVMVEVWAVGDLKRNLELVIPSLTRGDDVKVTIGVEYMWEPSQFSHCLVFGHKVGSCVKAKEPLVGFQGNTKNGTPRIIIGPDSTT